MSLGKRIRRISEASDVSVAEVEAITIRYIVPCVQISSKDWYSNQF